MNAGSGAAGSGSDHEQDGQTRTAQFSETHVAPGDVVGERFLIKKLIGMGGMGVVYLAQDQQLGVPVALKLLRPELATRPDSLQRFRQELLLSRQVSSPHVVRIHDLARFDSRWVISMDYVDGQGLDRYIDQRGRLPLDEAVAILRQLAEGLSAAHAQGVIHRDLKPANVLIDAHGQAYITDFGVARSMSGGGLTHTGTIVGTPEYIAPEQARAERPDARSDVYSLGLIFHEMLTGKLPFSECTPTEMLARKMSRQPPSLDHLPADIPDWVKVLCARMLQAYPAHRLQSARDVITAIDRQRVPRRPAKYTALVGLLVLCALGVVAFGIYWWARSNPATPPAIVASQVESMRIAVVPFATSPTISAESAVPQILDTFNLHLDAWLRRSKTVGIMSSDRVLQAMAESRIEPGTHPAQPEQLRKSLSSGALIVPQLQVSDDGYKLTMTLYRENLKPQQWQATASDASQLVSAYEKTVQQLLQELHLSVATPVLPKQPSLLTAITSAKDMGDDEIDALRAIHKDHPEAAWLALQLADELSRTGKDNQAIEVITTTLNARNSGNTRPDLELAALLSILRGDHEATLVVRRKIAESFPHDPQAQLKLAIEEGNAGELDSAVKRLAKLSEQDPGNARVWYLRGKLAILKGNAQRAVDDYLVRALVQFNRSRDTHGQAETINALGVGYGRLGQIDAARTEYLKALELRRSLDDKGGEATSLRNIAALDWVQGDFETAETRLHKARMLLEQIQDRPGLADLHNDLGLLAEERGNYATALTEFKRGLALRQELNDAQGIAQSLNNIGFSYYQQGQYDNARVYWQQSAAQFSRVNDQTGIVRSSQSLTLLDIARGNWQQARDKLQQTLDKTRDQQMREEQAVSLSYLATLDMLQGRLIDAGNKLDASGTIFKELEDKRGLAEIALQRARLQMLLLDFDQASVTLTALQSKPDDLGLEQHVELDLERARLANLRGNSGAAPLHSAAAAVAPTELRALQLETSLEQARDNSSHLKAIVDGMDANTPIWLRLRGLRYLLHAQVEGGQYELAGETYSTLGNILASHAEYVHAWRIHALGFHALHASGDALAAAQARQSADEALTQLLARIPQDARKRLQQTASRLISTTAKTP